MKTEMALKDGRVLEVEVSYSKGGANFMSGTNERRGYSLHCSPVKIERVDGHVTMRSFTISADPKERGLKSFLLEVARQSPKAQAQAEKIAATRLNRVLNEWLSRSGCEFVEPIPPHSIVDYQELPTILLTAAAPVAAPVPVARGMKMLTKEILDRLPALGSTSEEKDPVAQVRFFDPCGSWTWFGIEFDPAERIFYGYVKGIENEFGNFSLAELEKVRGPLGIGIERDLHFRPVPVSKIVSGETR